MTQGNLFSKEDEIARKAKMQIDAQGALGAVESGALLKAYQKLLRTSKRLMRLSDMNENALRGANEAISRKNKELEGLSSRLSKFLAPQLYDRLFLDRNSVDLSSERKRLTVMFSDLVGFTDLSDRLEPEELTGILNSYLEAMAGIVEDFGGTFDKFLGDGLMVFFGDPTSKGAHGDALQCVRMAMAMQDKLQDLRLEWRADGVSDVIKCRMGIHTGFCTVGNFGSPTRMDYTIIGSPVNLAARLEAQSEPNSILVSKTTQALLADDIEFQAVAPMQLKGFVRPVEAYRVVANGGGDATTKARALAQQFLDMQGQSSQEQKASIEVAERLLSELKKDL